MSQPGRVLQVIDSLAPGGAERVATELSNALAKVGYPVALCATRDGLGLAPELDPSISLVVLQRQKTWDWRAIRKLVRMIRASDIRILHAHGRSSTKLCALVKRLCRGQVSLIFHDHYGEIGFNREVEFSLRAACRMVDRYVAVDPSLAHWAVDRLGLEPERVSVIGNAVDLRRFTNGMPPADLGLVDQPLKAAMVANFRPQKDHPLLLQALARAPSARERLHIFLVGFNSSQDYMEDCLRLIQALELENNFSILGGRTDIPAILKSVDLGILASRSETGPLVLLEYLAAGLPFVATRTGYVAEQIAEAGLPYFSDPGDVHLYAENLEAVAALTDKDRALYIEKSQSIVNQDFDIHKNADRFIQIYQEIFL